MAEAVVLDLLDIVEVIRTFTAVPRFNLYVMPFARQGVILACSIINDNIKEIIFFILNYHVFVSMDFFVPMIFPEIIDHKKTWDITVIRT